MNAWGKNNEILLELTFKDNHQNAFGWENLLNGQD